MTRDEVKTILATMSAVYPPNLMPSVTELTVNVWFQLMQDVQYQDAQNAVGAWLTTEKYPPTIADIRERLFRTESVSPDQAWSNFISAVRKFGHTEKDLARDRLGDLWSIVGNDWMYYCTLPEDQIPNERSRFMRIFAAHQTKEKERAQIPAGIRDRLEKMRRLESGE